jgi:hypothetical protein
MSSRPSINWQFRLRANLTKLGFPNLLGMAFYNPMGQALLVPGQMASDMEVEND